MHQSLSLETFSRCTNLLTVMNYEQWNRAIISYIFEDRDPGEVVFLQTNAETLGEIAKMSGFNVADAAESLKVSVRDKVVQAGNRLNFWSIDPKNFRIHSPDKEPLQVAFLALTVLAASQMESDNTISPRDYYVRLNYVLFGVSIKGKPNGFNRNQFEAFWKHLQEWAEDKHDVELHLTIGPQTRRYVWFPISQSLINKHDRLNIQRFFHESNLKSGTHLAESQLLAQLQTWKSLRKFPAKIRGPIEQRTPEIRLILRQIQSLLKNWDGEPPDAPLRTRTKRRSVAIDVQLCFDLYGNVDHVRYWFRCRNAFPIPLEPNSLLVERLKPLDERWYQPFIVPDDRRSFWSLRNNLELKSANSNPLTFRLKSSDIWIFRQDLARDNGWLSQGNLLLHEEHRIVFREGRRRDVELFLDKVCKERNSPVKIRVAGGETGWQYLIVKPTALSQSSLMGYHVTTSDQIRLVGGLPADRRSNSYLDICLPMVVVPSLVDLTDESFYINDQLLRVPSNRKIEFPDGLDPGMYGLSYLDCRTTLRVVSPIRSTEHEKQTSIIKFDRHTKKTPIFKDCEVTEISSEPGVWLSGAKFFGKDIPEVTWGDVRTEPQSREEDTDSLLKSPAELISLVVKTAIELKQDKASVPDWLGKAIEYLDRNVALRSLVQKKLGHYHETALSYANLRKEGGNSHGSETVSRR